MHQALVLAQNEEETTMTISRGYILSAEGWELTIWPNGTGGTLKIEKSMEYAAVGEVWALAFSHEELADLAEFLVYVSEQVRSRTPAL